MKRLYTLEIEVMNGNMALNKEMSAYICKEMRDAALKKVKEANKNADVNIRYTEGEIAVYESASEIPILNE